MDRIGTAVPNENLRSERCDEVERVATANPETDVGVLEFSDGSTRAPALA